MFPKKYQFSAFDVIPNFTLGTVIKWQGFSLQTANMAILKGDIELIQATLDSPPTLEVPDNAVFRLDGSSYVNNYGPEGVCLNQFSFFVSFKSVELTLKGIAANSLGQFLSVNVVNMLNCAAACCDQNAIDTFSKELDLTLSDFSLWAEIENTNIHVAGLTPNTLTEKQAEQLAKQPAMFPIMSFQSPDLQYYLSAQLVIQNGFIKLIVQLFQVTNFGKHTNLIALKDYSSELPDYFSYLFITYWIKRFPEPSAPDLFHIHAGVFPNYNSQLLGPHVLDGGVLFNEQVASQYDGGAFTPYSGQIGILPVAKGKNDRKVSLPSVKQTKGQIRKPKKTSSKSKTTKVPGASSNAMKKQTSAKNANTKSIKYLIAQR